ncbi:pectate lyase, partial [Clostridium perfringens]
KTAVDRAKNIVSWQMEHGGWSKAIDYDKAWDGKAPRSAWLGPNGEELGMIDNDATTTEIRFLAEVYRETKDEALKDSILKGLDFLLAMQYDNGGFPQVYPKRGKVGEREQYSNFVTYNDGAMIHV